jgi:hypothetical protein
MPGEAGNATASVIVVSVVILLMFCLTLAWLYWYP